MYKRRKCILNKSRKNIITAIVLLAMIFTGCSQSTEVNINETSTEIISTSDNVDTALKQEAEANHSFKDPFVALDPYENAPLSAVVIFTTSEETSVNVKVLGHSKPYDIETTFGQAKEHVLPIYGLYAGEENKVILTLDDGAIKELKITTEIIDELYNQAVVLKAKNEKMKEGLTFVSLAMKSSKDLIAAAYDNNGDIRWALKGSVAAWDIYRLQNERLLVSTSEKRSEPYYTTGIREIDLMGKTYSEYIFPGGYHHSAAELPNGNFLVAAQDENSATVEDVTFEINRSSGEIVKTFDLKDVIPMDDGSSLSAKSDDWFHNNAVWYDDKTNSVLFSGRNADAVVSIDYETGSLRWILGDPEGWTKVDKKYFFKPVGQVFEWQYAQHASMVTPEGLVFLFDNGPFRAKKTNEEDQLTGDENYSRAVIYKIDEENMTIEQIWQYGKELGSDWYSYYVGDVDYLSKDHYLINSGGQLYDTVNKTHEIGFEKMLSPETQKSASIVEIKDDELIFEIRMNFNIFSTERMNLYTKTGDFELYTEAQILGKSN